MTTLDELIASKDPKDHELAGRVIARMREFFSEIFEPIPKIQTPVRLISKDGKKYNRALDPEFLIHIAHFANGCTFTLGEGEAGYQCFCPRNLFRLIQGGKK